MFNPCMLCFFLLCINVYLHLFLLVFMIASCVYNIIAFRLLGCILVYFCSPCMIACGDKNVGCALVHQRRSTSAAHRCKTPSGVPLVVRWSTTAQGHQRWSPSMAPLDWRLCERVSSSAQVKMCLCAGPAPVVQRRSTSAQNNFLARFQNDLTSLMASIYMLTWF